MTSDSARILVVEDNDTLRRGIAVALRERWGDVREVSNGNDAVECISDSKSDTFDVIVTDLILNALEAMEGEGEDGEKRLVLGLSHVVAPPINRSVRVGVDGRAASGAVARQEIVITVSDTGPGVPNELKEKIFYPFFTTKQSGSGVGLATAQKIVAGHGGALELDSEPGRGCSFRVRLPIEDEKP